MGLNFCRTLIVSFFFNSYPLVRTLASVLTILTEWNYCVIITFDFTLLYKTLSLDFQNIYHPLVKIKI